VETKVEVLTKEDALKILDKNMSNRPLRQPYVRAFRRLMENGEFQATHQGIAITEDGTLIDGQHRLNAFVTSNLEKLTIQVTKGAKKEWYLALDAGKLRTMSDRVILVEGDTYVSQASVRCCGVLFNLCRDFSPQTTIRGSGVTPQDIISTFELYAPEVLEVVRQSYRCDNKAPPLWTGRSRFQAHATMYLVAQPEKGRDFLRQCCTGIVSSPAIAALSSRLSAKYRDNELGMFVNATIYAHFKGKYVKKCGRRTSIANIIGFTPRTKVLEEKSAA
jgi:hypothetical protein